MCLNLSVHKYLGKIIIVSYKVSLIQTLLEGRAGNNKVGEKTGGGGGGLGGEARTQPEYMNSNHHQHQQAQSLEEAEAPPPQSSEYIQLSLANGPVSNGYIQIQQLPKNVLPGLTTTTSSSSSHKPELDSLSVALVDTGFQSPGYSQVGLINPPEPAGASAKAGPGGGGGYIQFPSGSPVVISPASLLDHSSSLGPSRAALEPRNTVV